MNINIRNEEPKDYRRVDEVDESFPPKEKKYQESQDEYESTISMLDE